MEKANIIAIMTSKRFSVSDRHLFSLSRVIFRVDRDLRAIMEHRASGKYYNLSTVRICCISGFMPAKRRVRPKSVSLWAYLIMGRKVTCSTKDSLWYVTTD
ncbi:hypothetical protein NE237_030957 [Protea cynaroides]|uniref:Uncharacterized protein n=1 Tax=Protea cynaroides TaxID=273540 RepID=A0A9Q0JXF8_9MAGN|nr:hypothetical protein NE237_030957 [Protea cynaroides]